MRNFAKGPAAAPGLLSPAPALLALLALVALLRRAAARGSTPVATAPASLPVVVVGSCHNTALSTPAR